MKKNLIRLMACVMAFAMVLSLAACGGNNSSSAADKSSSASSEASSSKPAESSEASSSSAASSEAASSEASTAGQGMEKYASIDEFLADPTVSSQLETMMSALGDDMSINVSGNGDQLVYTFAFTEEVDIESTKAAMQEQMNEESFASTFQDIAASLSDAIEVSNPSVVVTYLAVDGTEIYSQEYFPN